MSILSGKTIKKCLLIRPCRPRFKHKSGVSGGCGNASYDISLKQDILLKAGYTTLAVSKEYFEMPNDVAGKVCDKSTWARKGIQVQNTFIDPGWYGYLTLEISYSPLFHSEGLYGKSEPTIIKLEAGTPIAQVVFENTDVNTEGYEGKYQDQEGEPVAARFE